MLGCFLCLILQGGKVLLPRSISFEHRLELLRFPERLDIGVAGLLFELLDGLAPQIFSRVSGRGFVTEGEALFGRGILGGHARDDSLVIFGEATLGRLGLVCPHLGFTLRLELGLDFSAEPFLLLL